MNNKNLFLVIIITFFALQLPRTISSEFLYRYSVDLTKVTDHKLLVSLTVPNLNSDEVIFRIPKIVPGAYSIYDFGRFVSDFSAFNEKGSKLQVAMVDSSSWKISGSKQLSRITYMVRETWDPVTSYNYVFEPVGTSYDENKSYVLNLYTLFGYFDNMKKCSFEVNIIKPAGFYGSTAKIPEYTDNQLDKYIYSNYLELTDMPIMYTKPDTTIIKVGNTDVLVSVYSETNVITSKMLASAMEELLKAQGNYLNGELPVDKYAYLAYFAGEERMGSGMTGALEHTNSSLYYLKEGDTSMVKQYFYSAAAHEFFHIITPLTLYSEEIKDFDFSNPRMSKHLWLYEGVTEYFAGNVMVKEGLISTEQYLDLLKNKIEYSQHFNDTLPFTEMSKNVLTKYQREYVNVYLKGSLIGMCLDIKLLELSGGKYGLKDLITDLSRLYGKNKPFRDDDLFDVIAEISYPEIRDFFSLYVEGSKPLPLDEVFALAGVKFIKQVNEKSFTLGNVSLFMGSQGGKIVVHDTTHMNEFGKKMGYNGGDEILTINGENIEPHTYKDFIVELFNSSNEGDIMTVEVLRNGEVVKLKAPMMLVDKKNIQLSLSFEGKASTSHMTIRESWLGKNR